MCGAKWFKPFMQSYLVVFIGYLTMYPDPQNFNIAQNDMISTYGLSMTQLGMIGQASPSPTAWVKRWFPTTRTVKHQAVPAVYADPLRHLYARLQRQHGRGFNQPVLMIAFYALSGFFQSTGGSCSYSTITKWTPRRKRGSYLGMWNISHNLGGAGAAGVALFGANYLFDGHVIGMFIFPSIIALIVGFIGLRYGSDSRNLMASVKPKSCSVRRSAKKTKKPKKTR